MSQVHPEPMSTGILILGMHRSGTSALTRVVNLLGAALGERLMGAQQSNEEGHWESLAVYEAHEKLLAALGRRWDDFREMPEEWLAHPQTRRTGQAIARFVGEELLGEKLWAVKEPRMCRLMPMWTQALSPLPVRLVSILVIRNPLEVAASLARRNGMDHAGAILLWMQHLLEAERASRGLPRMVIHYSDLMDDWRASVAAISRELGFSWPRPVDEVAAEIDGFLSPHLRHHDVSQTPGHAADPGLPELAQRLYQASLRARTDASAWAEIAAISGEVEQAAALYGPCLDEVVAREQLNEDRAAAAEATVARGLAKPDLLSEQNDLIRQSRDQSHATLAELEKTGPLLAEMVRQIEAQRQESGEQLNRLADSLALAKSLDEKLSATQAALAAQTLRSGELERSLAQSQAQVAGMLASTSWKLTAPVRWLRLRLNAAADAFKRRSGRSGDPLPATAASGNALPPEALVLDESANPETRLQAIPGSDSNTAWRAGNTARSRVGAMVERVYRGVPVPGKYKRLFKGLLFRFTGPLFRGTGAYRRWQASERTHAASPRRPAAHGHSAGVAPLLQIQQLEADSLHQADGAREWLDYQPVRERIDAELARQQETKRAKRWPVLDFSGRKLPEAAAEIRLPAAPEHPDVTLLIPVFNHLVTTLECLASIAAHADPRGPSFEVLIANDASTDDTARLLATIANVRLVDQPRNLGFLRNCNTAAQQARGRYLLLLNNDVQVSKGWLRALVDCIEADPSIGAVGPKIVYPSGWLQEAGISLRRDGSSEMVGLNDLPDLPRYAYTRDVDYCSGASLLVRLEDFRRLGGFDERYAPAYCEDSDLCMRLRAEGRRIVYCAEATVVHHLSGTSDGMQGDYKLRCIGRNLQVFSSRWQAQLDTMDDVRTIAFYLPQFHPIPENNLWWGPGFTEWANVSKARPNYVGHYQPRVPADLGYYDLRVAEVMEQQAALAQRYGLGGFCFYYYWFAGHRLLERPIENMLDSGRPGFPFCLCWANENWTRRWDGEEHDVLMAQKHSDQDDLAVIEDLIRYFRSPYYIRIDGKPLMLIYRAALFPDFKRTSALWRQVCRDRGIGEIYIAHVESFDGVSAGIHPRQWGCDAAVEFPPHGMADPYPVTATILNRNFQGAVADYRDLAVRYATRELPAYKRFMGVIPGWDNTARRQNNSYCFDHATPGAFQAWLETAIARTRQQMSGDERLVFINAWNEWAEGAYLEPDRRFGHAFLQALSNARESGHLIRKDRYSLG